MSLATKNAGYGIEIVTYQPATGSAEYYAFVTNQSQDDTNGACTSGGAPVVAETVGGVPLYLSNTVQVVKIDPSSFPATNEQITNDVRVATVAVGCGPQGLAQWKDPSNGRAYLFVANAWEGSVSRVDATRVIEDVRSAVITNPDAPLGSPYVDASRSVNVFGAPTNQGLINRDILVTDVPTPSGDPQVPTLTPYVFVTVGRLNATHSGAVVALPTSLSTTARIFTNVAGIDDPPLPLSIGGFPVGLAARTEPDPLKKLDELVLKGIDPAPPACTAPNRSTTYRRRLVIVPGQLRNRNGRPGQLRASRRLVAHSWIPSS
ncbi:MAG: hypothetical protein IPK07_34595 [Deltaproteobacteria bacterium]|nr:hypothetical protein [Deltaproteobacteria bacterium]